VSDLRPAVPRAHLRIPTPASHPGVRSGRPHVGGSCILFFEAELYAAQGPNITALASARLSGESAATWTRARRTRSARAGHDPPGTEIEPPLVALAGRYACG